MLGFVLSFVIEPVAGAYSDPFSVRPEAESSRQLRRLLRLSARRLHRWSIDGGSCGRYVVRGHVISLIHYILRLFDLGKQPIDVSTTVIHMVTHFHCSFIYVPVMCLILLIYVDREDFDFFFHIWICCRGMEHVAFEAG